VISARLSQASSMVAASSACMASSRSRLLLAPISDARSRSQEADDDRASMELRSAERCRSVDFLRMARTTRAGGSTLEAQAGMRLSASLAQ
jgi:hypothetical protein